jgi:putative membrane protein
VNEESQRTPAQEIQIELARTRTLLAMDRTLLAWVRTSISLTAFGFALAKIVHQLIQHGTLTGSNADYPKHIGIILMVLGITGLLGGAFDYWQSVRRLKKSVIMPSYSTALIVALLLACISASLMVCLIGELNQ